MPLPLADLRVIDFTNAMAGPVCTGILGDAAEHHLYLHIGVWEERTVP